VKKAISILAALFLVAMLTYVPTAKADDPHFTTIDYPGAGLTVANGVNENGQIVGFYRMALPSGLGPFRGFLLSDGQFTTIHVQGATRSHAYGINNAGDIVGDYVLNGVTYGFLLRAGTTQPQTIQYPGATFTDSWGIDDQERVTGGFNDAQNNTRAYVWQNGTFTILQESATVSTYTHGLNARGEVVGCHFPDGNMHSLRVTATGDYLTEDFPGSMMSMHWRITESSIIVGHYVDMDGLNHGYLYKDGEYESIDYPGSIFTQTRGIAEIEEFNRRGNPLGTRQLLIVGPYDDSNRVRHGFLFTRRVGVGLGDR